VPVHGRITGKTCILSDALVRYWPKADIPHYERLPELAADLIRRRVAVIAATSTPAALAAKAATSTIPIVFTTASDPVSLGLVTSLARPGGNMTGATQLNMELGPKRLELMHQLLPKATFIALVVNPTNPRVAEIQSRDAQEAAHALGLQLQILHASTEAGFDKVVANLPKGAGGLVIGAGDSFFLSETAKLAAITVVADQRSVKYLGVRPF
jgi:putative ABC transport system substrate-binding protein